MAYSVSHQAGVNLVTTVTTNTNSAGTAVPTMGPLGDQVFGSDGKRYVLAKATEAITASTATCSINASTFAATGSGGSYTSPAVALASGDYAWFAATSV
jgi:hypothetical protein